MPLEPASYISDLVSTNPTATDGLAQADDHMRLIKAVLKATLPNLTGPMTATQADLNALVGAGSLTGGSLTAPIPTGSTTTGGKLVLKGAGANADITLANNASGNLEISFGATSAFTLTTTGTGDFLAAANAPLIAQAASALLPAGCILTWSGSSASIPAGFVLCNGSNGTPDLRDRFLIGAAGSLAVGASGGAVTQAPTTSSNGTHAHTGVVGAAGGHNHIGVTDTQGAHTHTGLTGAHQLVLAETPSHPGAGTMTVLNEVASGGIVNILTSGTTVAASVLQDGADGFHTHTISSDGGHSHVLTTTSVADHNHSISSDGGHTHTVTVLTLPPYFALCFIMKT